MAISSPTTAIDLDLFPAEIHALLGENGAGKSTLVKMMYGLDPAERRRDCAGRAQKIVLSGPSEARALGIGMVFQHFSLFENLTVAENVALGLPPTESLRRDLGAARARSARVYGLPLDPEREVWQLSVGERQRIEIVRALLQNPKLLILDEPTVGADAAGGRPALRRRSSGSRAKAARSSTSATSSTR